MDSGFLKIAIVVFWDHRELIEQAQKAKARVMKRAGGLVRGIMRRSIKNRKDPSPVGTPPSAHTKGGGIKNLIFWDYDPATESVIIGPALKSDAMSNLAPVPGTLERGGRSRIKLSKALKRKLGKETIVATIRPRPFAAPALKAFETSYPELWEGAIN